MATLRSAAGAPGVRVLVSLGLLAIVATRVDFDHAGEQLADGRWGLFVGAVAVLFVAFVSSAVRWRIYLVAAELATSRLHTVRAYLIGVFTTNFLPSQVGGDVARAWIVAASGSRTRSLVTVAVDRITALGCLFAVAWVALAARPDDVPHSLRAGLTLATAGYLAAASLLGALAVGRLHLGRLAPERLRRGAGGVRSASTRCLEPGVLTRTVALGLGIQLLTVLAAWLVAETISLEVPLAALVVILPLVVALGVVPFSIGGLGVREGGFVVLLGRAGVEATDAAVFSLLFGLAFALASLPGAGALMLRGTTVDRDAEIAQQAVVEGVDKPVHGEVGAS